jgi:ABC-type multidrug transport system fused ATPase/permease subunit
VVIIADGQIAEQGPPDELLARQGSRFAAMVRADTVEAPQ